MPIKYLSVILLLLAPLVICEQLGKRQSFIHKFHKFEEIEEIDEKVNYKIEKKHEVKALPGYNKPLPSKMFTGFLPIDDGEKFFHYWMVESENDPENDPLVFWYNGGPGASSLFGLFQELGPFILDEESYDEEYLKTGIPTLKRNLFSWTRNATIVAIDSPAPIGFSFCKKFGPAGNARSCGPWSDKSVFQANFEAYKVFFNEIFPNLKSNEFYLAGESYAGIYVPGFAEKVLDHLDELDVNFKGILVGDGCTGCDIVEGKPTDWCLNLTNSGLFKYPNVNAGPYYDIEFFHGHTQMSEMLYRTIKATCPDAELKLPNLTLKCQSLIQEMEREVGGFFMYDLEDTCSYAGTKQQDSRTYYPDKYGMNHAKRMRKHLAKHKKPIDSYLHSEESILLRRKLSWSDGNGVAGGGAPCFGNSLFDYFKHPEVLDAIAVPRESVFLDVDNGNGFDYTSDQPKVTAIYEKLLRSGKKILVYEGDTDACGLQTAVNEDLFVEFFEQKMKLRKSQSWRPFTVDGKKGMAGYSIRWKNRFASDQEDDVRFVSIRGAGHLVPFNQPRAALVMFNSFIQGKSFPGYIAEV